MSKDLSEIYEAEIDALEKTYEILLKELKKTLSPIIPGSHVSGRVKTKASLLRKAYDGKHDNNTWNDYHDILAFKVLTYRKKDSEKAIGELQRAFPEATVKTRQVHPMHLEYGSTHLIVTRGTPLGSGETLAKFEVQFRTLTEDAWYVIDHQLAYKPLAGFSPDDVVLRKVKRLLILAEIFDEEVELLMSDRESNALFASARAFDLVARQYDELTAVPSGVSEPSELFGLLFTQYTEEQRQTFLEWMPKWVDSVHQDLLYVINRHTPGAPTFVESRDWIYTQPEVLLIAEHSSRGIKKANSIVSRQDNEEILIQAIKQFSSLKSPVQREP